MQKKVSYLKVCLQPLSVCMLCLVLPLAVFAQKDTTKKLKEVKINTSPIPQIQTITPSQQISSSDFDRYNAVTVSDAIRDFAGVNIKDYGGIGGLKTVSVRGFGADHTAILYDGVQIMDTQNGQVDLGKLNLNGVQQITLYNAQPENILTPARSFASASVVSIKPIEPKLTADKPYQVLLGVKGGSFGPINPYLQWQQRISDRWSFMINSYYEHADGVFKFKNVVTDSTQTRNNADVSDGQAEASLYWIKNDSNKFSLHVNYYDSDRGLPSAVVPVSHERLWNQDGFLQAGYKHSWDGGIKLLLNTKFSQEYTRYRNPDFQNNQGGIDDRYKQREVYQSAAIVYPITTHWEASYATDVSYNDLGASSPIGSVYKYVYPSRFTLLNVLASNFTFGKWRFQGNLLNTYVNEQVKVGISPPERNVLSPTIMASFLPSGTPDLQLRVFYKNIFREPTFDEEYLFAINGTRDLKPEFAKQYDLGFTYRKGFNSFLDYFTLAVDGYYNTVSNKIVAIPNQNLEISSIMNLGNVRIEGTDVSLKTQTKQVNGWQESLSVNYTYQYVVDVDKGTDYYLDQVAYTPKNTLALNAGANYKQFGLYYNQILSSSRYYLNQTDPLNYLNGYSVSDLAFIYKFSAGVNHMLFSAHLDNLFNENYAIVRSFPMPGRSFLLSLQITI